MVKVLAGILALATLATLAAQEIEWGPGGDRTALVIVSDTPGVPVYLDGHFMGKVPLKGPVDVLPGWHRVSYFPDPAEELGRTLASIHRLARRDVLVEEGQTVRVVLSYRSLESEVSAYQRRIRSGRWVGLTLVILTMVIIGWAGG